MSLFARSVAKRLVVLPANRSITVGWKRCYATPSVGSPKPAREQQQQQPQQPQQPQQKKTSNALPIGLALAAAAAVGMYMWSSKKTSNDLSCLRDKQTAGKAGGVNKSINYKKVAEDIADLLDNDNYDDGSYGPLLVRLAWHASGTYCDKEKNGGSGGGTMRFHTEASDGANNGLKVARDLLEPLAKKYPGISYGDLWTLAGVVAIKEMGGPSIPWRSGRSDAKDESACVPIGRLPDASKDREHIRDVFHRMGFDDRETVALIGAHALGRCHADRSGYDGPWTFSPTMLSNDFYKLLLSEKWIKKDWKGALQYTDKATKTLMMLPTDMELIADKTFKAYTMEFAKDNDKFLEAFASAFKKLIELGIKYPETSQEITL